MKLYGFSNKPGRWFLEIPGNRLSEETKSCYAGYEVTIDDSILWSLFLKHGNGFFETEEETGVVTEILLKDLGYVF